MRSCWRVVEKSLAELRVITLSANFGQTNYWACCLHAWCEGEWMGTYKRLIAFVAMAGAVLVFSGAEGSAQNGAKNSTVVLDNKWQFRQVKDGQAPDANWMAATVPGDVHLDLLENKKIPDPFYRDNEAKLQWIQDESWEYRVNFDATPALLAHSHVDLVFDGLDATANVYLNGTQVLFADNMFRAWRVSAKPHLHAGANELRVVFSSPIKAAAAVAALDPWQPKTKTAPKTYVRKAAYEYGWDWGPTFVTSGIWRPVRLEAWDKVRIADFAIRQRDVSREVAHVDAEVEIEASQSGSANIAVRYTDGSKPNVTTRTIALHAGMNTVTVPIEIAHPKLWWPAG